MADNHFLSDEDAAMADATLDKRPPFLFFYIGTTKDAKVLALPSDSARWALARLWDEAKQYGGVFASEEQLEVCLGRYYSYVTDLRDGGFLHDLECHEWPEHQVDPATVVSKKMSRLGKRSVAKRKKLLGTAIPLHATNHPAERSAGTERKTERKPNGTEFKPPNGDPNDRSEREPNGAELYR